MALTEADITSKLYLAKNILLAGREIRVMFLLPESLGSLEGQRRARGIERPFIS